MSEWWVDVLARATANTTTRRRGLHLIAGAVTTLIAVRANSRVSAQSDCGGLFQPECPDPTECRSGRVCDGICVDVSQNDDHCGNCGRLCLFGSSCTNGRCESTGNGGDSCTWP